MDDVGWLAWSIASAVMLGFYDLAKKASVRDNAVPPVLFLNVFTGGSVYGVALLLNDAGIVELEVLSSAFAITWVGHLLLAGKAILVGSSWVLAFHALKHLPLSIAAPIRSTSPVWTVGIAVLIWSERPSTIQWLGVVLVVLSFMAFAKVGNREGIEFRRDRWVFGMIGATLLGAASSIYDKYLIQSVGLAPVTVQAWFSIYLIPVMLPQAMAWLRRDRDRIPFEFRWAIPAIAILLLFADYCYFSALDSENALVALISPVRRTSVAIPFAYGLVFLSERNWKAKTLCLVTMLVGVWFLSR
ncbi:MAG: EamA family transporter [Aureliella sp.]